MNISDAGLLLAYAALGDNRTVTRETAMFWSEVLRPDVSLDEARSAVTFHFANSTDYLTPAHVNEIVDSQREVRKRMVPDVIPPSELADRPEDGWDWTKVWQEAVIAGHAEARAREIANHRFGIDEDFAPLAIEAGATPSLRETLDRAERQRRDSVRLKEIAREVARRQAAEKREQRRAEVEASEAARHQPEEPAMTTSTREDEAAEGAA